MLKNDVKKKRFKNKKKKTTNKTQIGQKRNIKCALCTFFNNTIDITLPSPNKARDM